MVAHPLSRTKNDKRMIVGRILNPLSLMRSTSIIPQRHTQQGTEGLYSCCSETALIILFSSPGGLYPLLACTTLATICTTPVSLTVTESLRLLLNVSGKGHPIA